MRAYGEQTEKAAALARLGAAIVHEGWPPASAWPDLIRAGLALAPTAIGRLHAPTAVADCAAAIDALAALPGVRIRAVSPLYRTAPWGVTDQPDFRNAVVAADVALAPLDLLGERLLQAGEHGVGVLLLATAEDHLVAVLGRHFGDAGTHDSGPDDAHALDRRHGPEPY